MTIWVAILGSVAALITAVGALVVPIIQRRGDRNKPALDESNAGVARATVDKMVDERLEKRHTWRYARMVQLEDYLDEDQQYHRDDQEWHRDIVILLEEAKAAGYLGDVDKPIPQPPVPPVLPKPPPQHDQ